MKYFWGFSVGHENSQRFTGTFRRQWREFERCARLNPCTSSELFHRDACMDGEEPLPRHGSNHMLPRWKKFPAEYDVTSIRFPQTVWLIALQMRARDGRGGSRNEWVNALVNEGMNEWMKWRGEWQNGWWINGWMDEWVQRWMDGQAKGWFSQMKG